MSSTAAGGRDLSAATLPTVRRATSTARVTARATAVPSPAGEKASTRFARSRSYVGATGTDTWSAKVTTPTRYLSGSPSRN
jgi:hypothetical protein